MKDFGLDNELTTGVGQDMSLDEILSEFQAEQSQYAPPEGVLSDLDQLPSSLGDDADMRVYSPKSSAEDYPATEDSEPEQPGGYAAPALDYSPDSSIGAMELEARRYIAQMQERRSNAGQPEPPLEEREDSAADSQDSDTPESDTESGRSAAGFGAYPETEIDSRFNLSGKYDKRSMSYGSKEVDLSPDAAYSPTAQKSSGISHWSADTDPLAEEEDEEKPTRRKSKKKKKKKDADAAREQAEDGGSDAIGLDDDDAAPFEYANNGAQDRVSKYAVEDPGYFPPTFREYVASLVASLFLRMRGSAPADAAGTMNDTAEDLGQEVAPAAATRYYGSFVKSQKLRMRISSAVLIVLCYITLGLPIPGMLQDLPVAAAACCALLLAIMLLSLDTVTTGIMNAFRLKIGADSLAVLSCLISLADALIVALSESAARHMPLCALSALSLLGVTYAAALNTRALRKAIRVPAIGKHFYAVTGEIRFKDRQLTLLKSMRSYAGFVRRAEEAPPDETLYIKLGPLLILLALLLTTVVSAVHSNYSDFIYILSAVFVPAVPVMALSSFALPYFLGSMRIFKYGAAIAGWSGVCDIGLSRNLIVTDRDLFPEGSVTIEGVRIFADESSENVISYAGTLICASGSCTVGCFSRLMEENHCSMKTVEAFEYLPGGGISGIMDGRTVLCGSTDLMRLMNVRIPYRLIDKTSVLLAIDGILYGIFTMKYSAQPKVRKALVDLVRSTRHPVFAIRDFNVNPEMLHNTFELATDGYDFPPYVDRFGLSDPSQGKDGKIAAIICSEGLGPLTSAADVGRGIYVASRVNLLISVLSAVLGIFAVFIKLITVGSVSAGFLLLFMAAWAVPVLVMSLTVMLRQ